MRLFWLFVIVVCLELFLTLALVPSEYVKLGMLKERAYIADEMGETTALALDEQAHDWYKPVMIDTGISDAVTRFVTTSDETKQGMTGGAAVIRDKTFPYFEDRVKAFVFCMYWSFKRVALLLLWLPAMLPVFILAMFHGLMFRKVKMQTFAFSSPLVEQIATWGAVIGVFGLLLLFFLPFAVPPVVAPTLLAGIGILIGLSISNMRKRI